MTNILNKKTIYKEKDIDLSVFTGDRSYISFFVDDEGYSADTLKELEDAAMKDPRVKEKFLQHLDEFKRMVREKFSEHYGYEDDSG